MNVGTVSALKNKIKKIIFTYAAKAFCTNKNYAEKELSYTLDGPEYSASHSNHFTLGKVTNTQWLCGPRAIWT
jgi:hypothetical protein